MPRSLARAWPDAARPAARGRRRRPQRGEGSAGQMEQRWTTGTSPRRRARAGRAGRARPGERAAELLPGPGGLRGGPLRGRGSAAGAGGHGGQAGQLPAAGQGHAAPSPRTTSAAESEHFIFFYPKGKDEVLVPYALETLEAHPPRPGEGPGLHAAGEGPRRGGERRARAGARSRTLTQKQIRTTGTIAICKFNKLMVTSPKAVAARLRLAGHAGARVHAPGRQPDEPQHGAHLAARGPGQVPRVALARPGRAGA